MRRQASARLGEIGVMADTPALRQALRDADADTRVNAEKAMWQIWERSGNQQVDRLYQAGVLQMKDGDLNQAIATFTRIVGLKPDFAEGWNKRATLYFLTGEYRKSLDDCAQVIKRTGPLRRAGRLRPNLPPARGLRARPRLFPSRARGQPQHGQRQA
jgi:tetratricopeptide (TPR) repeat protein